MRSEKKLLEFSLLLTAGSRTYSLRFFKQRTLVNDHNKRTPATVSMRLGVFRQVFVNWSGGWRSRSHDKIPGAWCEPVAVLVWRPFVRLNNMLSVTPAFAIDKFKHCLLFLRLLSFNKNMNTLKMTLSVLQDVLNREKTNFYMLEEAFVYNQCTKVPKSNQKSEQITC